jgi:hypothetical protein
MKSLAFAGAVAVALFVAGCKSSSTTDSDGMMSGKSASTCSDKKEGQCPFQAAAAKKDDCGATEAKAEKKEGCCASEAKATEVTKTGCCAEGKTEAKAVKVKADCCKGKDVSAMCAACKKSGEGACETEKKCDGQKKCDETKP